MVYDINLLPRGKRNESSKIGIRMLMVGILCAMILIGGFLFYPLRVKVSLMNKLRTQEQDIVNYAAVEEEYNAVSAEVARLNNLQSTLEELRASKKNISPLLDEIEECMPRQITLTSVQAENGLLTINGEAEIYKQIAQFMINLRGMKEAQSVTFTTATVEETTPGTDSLKQPERTL